MDKVFSTPNKKQFEFDEAVASVFDDMLSRSVPLYDESIEFIANLIVRLFPQNATILDLGCSTANTLLALFHKNKNYTLFGLDNAKSMLDMAKKKIEAYGADISLKNADILQEDFLKNDVIIANYMLQFIRPLERAKLVRKIHESLNDDGIFIFSEKIIFHDKTLDKIMIDLYLDFKKKQGYSQYEISQKREALENILVPYTQEENIKMLQLEGFKSIQTLIQWGNFCTFLAKK